MTRTLPDHDTLVRLARAREAIAESLGERVVLASMAEAAALSPFHFHRLLHVHLAGIPGRGGAFGETPHEFVTRRRMDEARRLVARTDTPVTEVCLAAGYESLGTFSARFRERVGYSPSVYRRSLRRVFAVPELVPYRFIPSCFLSFYGVPSVPAMPRTRRSSERPRARRARITSIGPERKIGEAGAHVGVPSSSGS